MTRPGTRLRLLAQRLCDRSTVERLIDPAIADLQHEYEEAIRRGLMWRARGIRLTGYAVLGKVAAVAAARQALAERTSAEHRAVGRTVVFSLGAVIVLTPLLLFPALGRFSHRDVSTSSLLVVYLIPQALAVAIPLGLVFGILLGLRDQPSTARVNWTILALALLCSSLAFFVVAWLMPAANQAFREMIAGRPLLRGLNELTLGELASADPARVTRVISAGVTTRRLAWEFHLRLVLACAPLVLGLFSIAVTTGPRRNYGRVAMSVAALMASLGYVLLFDVRQRVVNSDWVPPLVAAWLPNLVFLMLALLFSQTRHLRRNPQGS
jgi:hypothetical protein